jgi:hypothetical protein
MPLDLQSAANAVAVRRLVQFASKQVGWPSVLTAPPAPAPVEPAETAPAPIEREQEEPSR